MSLVASLGGWAQPSVVLLVVAGLAVATVGASYARLDKRWRRLRYRRAKGLRVALDPTAQLPEAVHPTALLQSAQEPGWFAACQSDLNSEDRKAEHLQTRYHSCVARCVVVLSVGVIIMCISVIIFRESSALKKFVTHFDLIATIYALICFAIARVTNKAFVAQRSLIETLRAWMHLALVFPLERSLSANDAYPAEKQNIRSRLQRRARHPWWPAARGAVNADAGQPEAAIYRRVEDCWTNMQADCRSLGLRQPNSALDLGFYLKERPLEQFKYFVAAQWRIHYGQKWREDLILFLYISSVALAILKALNVFKTDFPPLWPFELATWVPLDLITTALLAVMVVSAAATNSLISRNERSLLHSYHAQERRIRKWFDIFAAASESATEKQLVETILAFEDIMLNDLLDFIHITSRDVIEVPG